jgi:hypothetical protein
LLYIAFIVSGGGEEVVTCPTCNSTLVIEMDEVPLPSHHRNDQGEKQSVALDSGPPSSAFNSSPSQSSIGMQSLTLRMNILYLIWYVLFCFLSWQYSFERVIQ